MKKITVVILILLIVISISSCSRRNIINTQENNIFNTKEDSVDPSTVISDDESEENEPVEAVSDTQYIPYQNEGHIDDISFRVVSAYDTNKIDSEHGIHETPNNYTIIELEIINKGGLKVQPFNSNNIPYINTPALVLMESTEDGLHKIRKYYDIDFDVLPTISMECLLDSSKTFMQSDEGLVPDIVYTLPLVFLTPEPLLENQGAYIAIYNWDGVDISTPRFFRLK